MTRLPRAEDIRRADYVINSLFLKRWSPRAMSGESITDEEMFQLFEAARWAPSTFNEQEWRFLYARRETVNWALLFDLLEEGNKVWAKNSAMLVVIVASKTFAHNGKPNPVYLFDAGAAWENLALQASMMGLVAHGMQGFDWEKARASLHVPDDFAVAAMFAVGRPGDPEQLPEALKKREIPSTRRPIAESICDGVFSFDSSRKANEPSIGLTD